MIKGWDQVCIVPEFCDQGVDCYRLTGGHFLNEYYIVSEAETKAASILGSIDERIATEENRLQQAKISAAKFLDQARTLCQDQLNKLDLIAASNTVAAAASDKDSVRIPQENNAPAADKSAFDAGNTQVFSFSKDN